MEIVREDGRKHNQIRTVRIVRNYLEVGEGSVLVEFGKTKVLCVASFTAGVPRWREGSGLGWVTGEYAMLPRATDTRNNRESVKGKVSGRTQEISRLIGRSLRAVVNFSALEENTIMVDCDVIQADGGTRTASITGAYVALYDAIRWAIENRKIKAKTVSEVIPTSVSAISVGIIGQNTVLDLPYQEDCKAETDMNVVMTGNGEFVEIQGTAEGKPFTRNQINEMLDLALLGTKHIADLQIEAIESGSHE